MRVCEMTMAATEGVEVRTGLRTSTNANTISASHSQVSIYREQVQECRTNVLEYRVDRRLGIRVVHLARSLMMQRQV